MAAVTVASLQVTLFLSLPGYHDSENDFYYLLSIYHLWSPLTFLWGPLSMPSKAVKPLPQMSSVFISVYLVTTKDQKLISLLPQNSFQPTWKLVSCLIEPEEPKPTLL